MTEQVQIALITRSNEVQPREVLNWERVKEYAERMKAGDKFPPVVAFFDGETRWLAAGFHRMEAFHEAGFYEIDVDLRQGTQRDAILYAVGDNAAHGLYRSNQDKQRAVTMLLNDEEWGQWSDNKIAEQCHVSPTTVGTIRRELRRSLSKLDSDTRTYTTKHGTTATMQTANIGRKAGAQPKPEPVALPAVQPPPSNGARAATVTVVPRGTIPGTKEYIDAGIWLAHSYAEYAANDIAQAVRGCRELRSCKAWEAWLTDEPKTWERFCQEALGYDASFIEAIEQAAAILERTKGAA